MIRVYTMEQINTKFANTRVPTDSGKEIADFFSVDGVVNNLDGLDTHNEFRDHAIANTAIQGPCRLAVSAEEAKRVQIGDVLYIGLQATKRDALEGEAEPTYKLELYRFFSSDVTRMKTGSAFEQQLDKTKRAWAVGRIIDSNQSHRMTTIHVCVDQVQEITDAMLDMMVSERYTRINREEEELARYVETIDRQPQGVRDVIVLEMTVERPVKDQLLRRWRRAAQGR